MSGRRSGGVTGWAALVVTMAAATGCTRDRGMIVSPGMPPICGYSLPEIDPGCAPVPDAAKPAPAPVAKRP